MKTPHIIPLSRQAVEVLRALKLLTGNGKLVFPGAKDKKRPMSNNTLLYALYRLGYEGRMTGHGFRGLASTILNENDFDDEHVDLQLAHMKRNKVSAAYTRLCCDTAEVDLNFLRLHLSDRSGSSRHRSVAPRFGAALETCQVPNHDLPPKS
jgi:integrase